MKNWNFERWLGQIYATEEEEISCSDCFDWISEYVDRELTHSPLDPRMQRVRQHLGQCRVCREEYEVLHELASQELPSEANSPGGK